MKKGLAILFLAVFLLANTEVHEFLRLPVLIHHFIEHKKMDVNISFFEFFKEHYTQKSTHKIPGHDNQHRQLPFKANDSGAIHTSIAVFEPSVFYYGYQNTFFDKEETTYTNIFFSSAFLSNIWQPPKTA